ncbi:hypothetical protein GOP47_0023179, partial [Adiantum capillus-veneris]
RKSTAATAASRERRTVAASREKTKTKKQKKKKEEASDKFEWPKPSPVQKPLHVVVCSKGHVKHDCLQRVEEGVVGVFENEEQAYAEAIRHEISENQRLEKAGELLESAELSESLGEGGVNKTRFASTLQRKALRQLLHTVPMPSTADPSSSSSSSPSSSMEDLKTKIHRAAASELWNGNYIYGYYVDCHVIKTFLFPPSMTPSRRLR